MGDLVRFPTSERGTEQAPPSHHVPALGAAVESFFAHKQLAANSERSYRHALDALVGELGAGLPVANVTAVLVETVFQALWSDKKAATWNTRRIAVRAFLTYCGKRWPMPNDPMALVEHRNPTTDARKAVPFSDLESLFTDRSVALREKTLWRMLYETAARASEVLALDVDDLNLARKRAYITGKGGDIDLIHWSDATARLLTRYLGRRKVGPLFLTARKAPLHTRDRDVCPTTGRGRLSYRRAAQLFATASGRVLWPDEHKQTPDGGEKKQPKHLTLHQLRHSALTRMAETESNLAVIQAKSRHRDIRTLQVYAKPGAEAVAEATRRFTRPDKP